MINVRVNRASCSTSLVHSRSTSSTISHTAAWCSIPSSQHSHFITSAGSADRTIQLHSQITASRAAAVVHKCRSYLRPANVFSMWTSNCSARMATRALGCSCWSRPQPLPYPVRIGTTTNSARLADTPATRTDRRHRTVARWCEWYEWGCWSSVNAPLHICAILVAHYRVGWRRLQTAVSSWSAQCR